ncbi:MAG: gamma-glutamyltransferase [Alphaproteobacteria bacterium]|nr:gamma-glutamyltransferase [Alphaproteobacteria bacterium]
MRNLELPGRSPVHATGGMAATSHPLSTAAALDMLKNGGNAMDAAITACAVQCVVEPQSTGIGGDCFVLYAPGGSADILAYNGSGRAPAKATADWFADQGISEIGVHSPHSVTVPGAVDAWCRLLEDHGTKSLDQVLGYAIDYARDGFPVHDRVASDWKRCETMLGQDESARRIYLPDGHAPEAGHLHKQPELARTLKTIAAEGRDGFYRGSVAEDIASHLKSLGGAHEIGDFADAAGEYVTPVKTSYRGYEVHECPPNGQGIIALLMLNILADMGLDKLDPLSPERLHLFIEAGRLAYAERNALISDPDQVDVPVDMLLSAEHAAELRGRIDPSKATAGLPPEAIPHSDTVYLTVVDKDRNAVSFINSLFQSFGSGLVGPKSGVILQNRGYSFNLDPAHPNCIAPNKRPMHTIIPGMLTKGDRAVMPFGVMGGHYQSFGHAYFLTNLFEHDLDLQEAMDLPRLFPAVDGPVEVESGMPDDVVKALQGMGHKTAAPAKPIGGAQAIWIDWQQGVLTGGSEPRKDGLALGY